MFAWISKRASPWSRSTRWTPLLESQREFQRTLAKERSRVDRDGGQFGFVILRLCDLAKAQVQTVRLAKLLHRRLRLTDEKGHLGLGRIGLLLPMTTQRGSDLVLSDILRLAAAHHIRLEGEAFVYPEPRIDDTTSVDEDISVGIEIGTGHSAASVPRSRRVSTISPLAIMLPSYPVWKRVLDVSGAIVGLAAATPLLLVCSILIKLTSRGPILFHQQRTGFLGESFTIYKLRTMVVNADALKVELRECNERDGPAFKMRQDPRITTFGKVLRATGLDELPQFVNVLKGEMSLVGPRPLPVDEAQQCLSWQRRRHEVKPGLTCFWQVSKSRQLPFVDWMRLDLKYAQNRSLALDLKLLAKTCGSVFLGRVGH